MMNVEIKKLPDGIVELKGEIPVEQFESYRPQAIKKISAHSEIAGFRKGKAPENVLIQKFGEEKILYEMAELALDMAFPEILLEHKIDAIGHPTVSITKIARGNPLGFSITISVMPEIILPDYKSIAQNINKEKNIVAEVTENEVAESIKNIQKQVAQSSTDNRQQTTNNKNREATEPHKIDGGELPALNDEFVKKLGTYADVADFTAKLKDHLAREKELRAREKKRIRIMDDVLKKTPLELPHILINEELDKMTAQFKGDVVRMGVTFEDYLKHIKKTEEEVRKEWTPDATKRASIELILHKISNIENILPTKEEVSKEVGHILEHHKDADPKRAQLYVLGILTNEKVLRFLEEQK